MIREILKIWREIVVFFFGFILPVAVAVILIAGFLAYFSK